MTKTAFVLAACLLGLSGCGGKGGARRVKVSAVNLVSADGKGWVHSGPIYSVGALTSGGEQLWFISVHKLLVGKDICVEWVMGNGWQTTPCPAEDPAS